MLSKTATFAALFAAVIALPLSAQDSARVPVAPTTAPLDAVSVSLQGAELGSDGAYLVTVGQQYRIQVSSQLPDSYTALVYSHKGAWLGFALGTTPLCLGGCVRRLLSRRLLRRLLLLRGGGGTSPFLLFLFLLGCLRLLVICPRGGRLL